MCGLQCKDHRKVVHVSSLKWGVDHSVIATTVSIDTNTDSCWRSVGRYFLWPVPLRNPWWRMRTPRESKS